MPIQSRPLGKYRKQRPINHWWPGRSLGQYCHEILELAECIHRATNIDCRTHPITKIKMKESQSPVIVRMEILTDDVFSW